MRRAGGQALCFEVSASEETIAALESLLGDDREAEWGELCTEFEKAVVELRREIESERFTLAERVYDARQHS